MRRRSERNTQGTLRERGVRIVASEICAVSPSNALHPGTPMHDSDVVRRAALVTAFAVFAACADKHAVAPNLVIAAGTPPSHILQPVASGYAQIGAGRNHTCMLYNNRVTVYCWGDNRAGEAPAAFTTKLGSVVQLAVGSQ